MLRTSCRGPADHHSEEMNLGTRKVPIQKATAAVFAVGWASVMSTKITVVTIAAAGSRNPKPTSHIPSLRKNPALLVGDSYAKISLRPSIASFTNSGDSVAMRLPSRITDSVRT